MGGKNKVDIAEDTIEGLCESLTPMMCNEKDVNTMRFILVKAGDRKISLYNLIMEWRAKNAKR